MPFARESGSITVLLEDPCQISLGAVVTVLDIIVVLKLGGWNTNVTNVQTSICLSSNRRARWVSA